MTGEYMENTQLNPRLQFNENNIVSYLIKKSPQLIQQLSSVLNDCANIVLQIV